MRAIRVHEQGGPEVLRLEEAPDPAPGPGQVLVRLHAIGVNPVDVYLRAGQYGPVPLPYTPGQDGAGVVAAVGEGVTNRAVGDRVYVGGSVSGTYAELVLCGADQVHPLPDRVTFAQGAAVNTPYGTAYRALSQRARAVPGETVLVHGASGGVGIAAVQLARAAGLTVIGTAGSEDGRRLALQQGAQHVLDHHDPGHLDQARELTAGQGVDVVVELLANVNLGSDLGILAKRGRVAVVGSRGPVEINPRGIMGIEGEILGVMMGAATAKERRAVYAAIGAGLANGTLCPVVGLELPLGEAAEAHRVIMEGPHRGKIVLLP